MRTIDDVFEAFGGTTAFAKALGLGQSTASEMRRRGSIPSEYWDELVSISGKQGLGLTDRMLSLMHSRKRRRARAA